MDLAWGRYAEYNANYIFSECYAMELSDVTLY